MRAFAFAFVVVVVAVLAGVGCAGGVAATCSENSECPDGELCFADAGGSGTCRAPDAGEGEGEGIGEGEGAPEPVVTLSADELEGNTQLDTTLHWTLENVADPTTCSLTQDGVDAGADIASLSKDVSITADATFALTCGTASDSVDLRVFTVGNVSPTVVAAGAAATFTFATNSASCGVTTDGDGTNLSTITIAAGVASFTDVVEADKSYIVHCDGAGDSEIVRPTDVRVLVVTPTNAAVIVDAGGDLTLEAAVTDGATCTLASALGDGSDARDETVAEAIGGAAGDATRPHTFAVGATSEARTYTITCALEGAVNATSIDAEIRPTIDSFTGAFSTTNPFDEVDLAYAVTAQDQGECTLGDGVITGDLDPSGTFTVAAGAGLIAYTITCRAADDDPTPAIRELKVFWGEVDTAFKLTQAAQAELLVGTVVISGSVSRTDFTTGALTDILGDFVLTTVTSSPTGSTFVLPNVRHIGGGFFLQDNVGIGSVTMQGTGCDVDSALFVSGNTGLTSLDLTPLTTIGGFFTVDTNAALTTVTTPNLAGSVNGDFTVTGNANLTGLTVFFSEMTGELNVQTNLNMTQLNLPLLGIMGAFTINDNDHLTTLNFQALDREVGEFVVTGNAVLTCNEIFPVYCDIVSRDTTPTISGNQAASCSTINSGC